MTDKPTHCRICGNAQDNAAYTVREMMFGFRDEFDYISCGACGCLQICDIPPNMAKYYPDDYYAYEARGEAHFIRQTLLKRIKRSLKKKTLDYYLADAGLVGSAVTPKFSSYYPWLKKGALRSQSRILDIGCGTGELLLRMYNDGFTNLSGVDPFIPKDLHYACGVTIQKKTIAELEDQYDLVMMHHSFEHMPEPKTVLQDIRKLLLPNSQLVIRMPVAGTYAWRTYGVNWVQLDAPRHFFLHTEKSMRLLAGSTGFRVSSVEYDSYEFQFTGSEQYQKDLPLVADSPPIPAERLRELQEHAKRLNRAGDGDSACFYLEPVD